MARFNFEMKGDKALLKALDEMTEKVSKQVGGEIEEAANRIEAGAKNKAPTDMGDLRQSINAQFDPKTLQASVGTNLFYAPFVEFGTGSRVQIPAGLESYASQFKNSSQGDFTANITAWLERKGIPEEAWGAIMASIARNGTYPHPFLFNTANAEIPKLLTNLQKIKIK